MIKAVKALFVLLLLAFTVSGSLAAEKTSKSQIKTVDHYVAVFDFEVTTGDKGISRPLTESVRREIVLSGKYNVIDRGNMEKILGEQKLQMSGCVTGECIVEAGQLLGVGKLISGTVSMVGKTYYLTLSLISVKTGEIENVAEDKCRCEVDELLDSTKRLAKKLLGEKVEEPAAVDKPGLPGKPAAAIPYSSDVIELDATGSLQIIHYVPSQDSDNFRMNLRKDLKMDTWLFDKIPYHMTWTSNKVILRSRKRIKLAGDSQGRMPWEVDNFLLLETTDSSGVILKRVVVGYNDDVSADGKVIEKIGPQSLSFPAGSIDVTHLFPINQQVTLKASAMDYGYEGKVSDIFLIIN